MMPFWVTVVVRGPCLLYIAGYPLWHIAMTVERAWATLRVHQYEKISSSYGTVSASVVVGPFPGRSNPGIVFSGFFRLRMQRTGAAPISNMPAKCLRKARFSSR